MTYLMDKCIDSAYPMPSMSDTHELSFSGLGLSPQILSLLSRLQFKTPTPIQHQSIPASLDGKDIIGIAQTGTGKTLAFGLPLLQRLKEMQGIGLILIPTRELALQVEDTLRKVGGSLGLTTAVLIGGESFGRQVQQLKRRPRIIVATPGRLIDHLEQRTVELAFVKILVLDEADRMLDMGFAPQINQILRQTPRERQTLLFSATMPSAIAHIAATHMKLPVRVEVAPAGTSAEKVEQEIIIVPKDQKSALLESVLRQNQGTALVFSRTKHGAKKICHQLNQKGVPAAEIHSNRSQSQRKEALDGFRRNRYRVLVATDIAARGIDVSHIELVINYDLPDNSEDYVHRIGRTGRAGREGKAISFATPDQRGDIRAIERLIRKTLKVISHTPSAIRAGQPARSPENSGEFHRPHQNTSAARSDKSPPQSRPQQQSRQQPPRRPHHPKHQTRPSHPGQRSERGHPEKSKNFSKSSPGRPHERKLKSLNFKERFHGNFKMPSSPRPPSLGFSKKRDFQK